MASMSPAQDSPQQQIEELRAFSKELIRLGDTPWIKKLHHSISLAYLRVAAQGPTAKKIEYTQDIIKNIHELKQYCGDAMPGYAFPRILKTLGSGVATDEKFDSVVSRLSELFDELFATFKTPKAELVATPPPPAA